MRIPRELKRKAIAAHAKRIFWEDFRRCHRKWIQRLADFSPIGIGQIEARLLTWVCCGSSTVSAADVVDVEPLDETIAGYVPTGLPGQLPGEFVKRPSNFNTINR